MMNMRNWEWRMSMPLWCLWGVFWASLSAGAAESAKLGRWTAVPFTAVTIDDAFWSPRIETNRKNTIWYDFRKCEETGRLSNFTKAAGRMPGKFEGIFFNDSDVYKVIEGAAYSLQLHPDPELDKYLDKLIDDIAAAQHKDGYLNTYYTLAEPGKRWTNLPVMHELYCCGHLFEAAVAHYQATGKKTLLNVAIKLADHIDATFGPGKKIGVPGHQEIEIGLVKLHGVTKDERYLKLAKFFLDERGKTTGGRKPSGTYNQDHKPVIEQTEAVGHAVRAGYMYCGMADVAALTGDQQYVAALDKLWADVVGRKMYITGGIGALHSGEAFGKAYELPNRTAYNETCATIAAALWAHRMGLLHGKAEYFDVLELALYNGFLSGVSLSGQEFHYPNPLESDGKYKFNHGSTGRQGWFDCSCCPVNVVRIFPQLGGFMYAQEGDRVYVNLFATSTVKLSIKGKPVTLRQETKYPWDGEVKITVDVPEPLRFELAVRNPGWSYHKNPGPVASDLYQFVDLDSTIAPRLGVHAANGAPAAGFEAVVRDGYSRIAAEWSKGSSVTLEFPMPARRVRAHDQVEANRGRVALLRGPIVYCLEGADHQGRVLDIAVPRDAKFTSEHRQKLLGGVTVLKGQGVRRVATEKLDEVKTEPVALTAIPYYAWNHRGTNEMAVWLPEDPKSIQVKPAKKPTLASTAKPSASHTWSSDTVDAFNDQEEPKSSGDGEIPRHTWWSRRGTKEWAQYDWSKPQRVSGVSVYWFDDTGRGSCRVPKAWRLLYRTAGPDGQAWKEVSGVKSYGVAKDRYNRVEFSPVETTALRIEAELAANVSGGILEWQVAGER